MCLFFFVVVYFVVGRSCVCFLCCCRRVVCVKEMDFVGHFNKEWECLFENFTGPPQRNGTLVIICCKVGWGSHESSPCDLFTVTPHHVTSPCDLFFQQQKLTLTKKDECVQKVQLRDEETAQVSVCCASMCMCSH